MKNENRITTETNDEMTPKDVAQRIADLVLLFAEREIDWLAEHGYEFDINVFAADSELLASAMITPRTRDVSITDELTGENTTR
jgi:hypothetical protein